MAGLIGFVDRLDQSNGIAFWVESSARSWLWRAAALAAADDDDDDEGGCQ